MCDFNHKAWLRETQLVEGRYYFGYAERDGWNTAKWDGEHFHVPRLKFGIGTTIPYDGYFTSTKYARFYPVQEEG